MIWCAGLLPQLKRKLGEVEENSERDKLLLDALEDAAAELKLYLNRDTLPVALEGYLVRIAALLYQRDLQALDGDSIGVKSWNYSEQEQSQSETYFSDTDFQNGINAILSSLSRYRVVRLKGGIDHDPA